MYYLDTSAYLTVLLAQTHYKKIQKLIKGVELCSSTFLLIESERNLVSHVRSGYMSQQDFILAHSQLKEDAEKFMLLDLSSDLCLSNQYPTVTTPRSADLIHLRSARWFQTHYILEKFVTLDKHQAQSAKEMNLPVWDS